MIINQIVQLDVQKSENATENIYITPNIIQTRHEKIGGKYGRNSNSF